MIVCLASPTHATVFHCSTLAKWSMVTSSAMVPVSLQISAPLSLPFYLSLNSVELSKANWYIRSSELRLCHENADVVPRQEDKTNWAARPIQLQPFEPEAMSALLLPFLKEEKVGDNKQLRWRLLGYII